MRRMTNLVLLAGVLAACADAPTDARPVSTGTVSVRVNGLLRPIMTRGTAVITRVDIGNQPAVIYPLALSLTTTIRLPVGEYVVRYLPPEDYESTVDKQRIVISEEGRSTEAAFVVTEIPYQLLVDAVPVPPLRSSLGGTVTVTRTDLPDQPSTSAELALYSDDDDPEANSYFLVRFRVPPGTYNVVYTPPADFVVPVSVAQSRSVQVSRPYGGSARFAFAPKAP